MSISWEAVTAVGTIFSGAVIAGTVIIAIRQLDLLRRSTQLEGAMKIFDEFSDPELRSARLFVVHDLPGKLNDPAFAKEVELGGRGDDAIHRELVVLRFMEKVGTYVHHGLIDRAVIFDYAAPIIIGSWESLREIALVHRRTASPDLWTWFEKMAQEARAYSDRQTPGSAQAIERIAKERWTGLPVDEDGAVLDANGIGRDRQHRR